jgi:NADPH:quinone reductase-like Zn-dependent oxidoreductase
MTTSPDTTSPDTTMRAVQYDSYGPPAVLRIRTVDIPALRPGHILVRVTATSINAADTAIRSGKLRRLTGTRFPRGSGFDFTGEVTAVAEDVDTSTVGDLVWGFINSIRQGPTAAAADYVLAPAGAVALAPSGMDPVSAAALPGAAGSALRALRRAGLLPGERILIRGAGGGVGTAAVQLAHSMGAHITALARAEHLDFVRALGADAVADYHRTDPPQLGPFDVVLDPVASDLRAYRQLLSPRGRYLAMTIGGASDGAYLAASTFLGARRVRLTQAPPDGVALAELTSHVDAGTVHPVIHSTYQLDDIAAAHRSMQRPGGFGKRVVVVNPPALCGQATAAEATHQHTDQPAPLPSAHQH